MKESDDKLTTWLDEHGWTECPVSSFDRYLRQWVIRELDSVTRLRLMVEGTFQLETVSRPTAQSSYRIVCYIVDTADIGPAYVRMMAAWRVLEAK